MCGELQFFHTLNPSVRPLRLTLKLENRTHPSVGFPRILTHCGVLRAARLFGLLSVNHDLIIMRPVKPLFSTQHSTYSPSTGLMLTSQSHSLSALVSIFTSS